MKKTADCPASQRGRAYPFLVGRNRLLDHRPVVAPDFMIDHGGEYVLVHAADPGNHVSPSPVFERIITTKRHGDLTLLARSLPATADLIGGSPQEQLMDKAGRPIELVEGLVLPGRHPGCTAEWQHLLADVDVVARQAFPEFWESEDEAAPPTPSQPLTTPRPANHSSADPARVTCSETPPDGNTPHKAWRINTDSSMPLVRCFLVSAITFIVGMAILYVVNRLLRR